MTLDEFIEKCIAKKHRDPVTMFYAKLAWETATNETKRIYKFEFGKQLVGVHTESGESHDDRVPGPTFLPEKP